MFFPLLSPDLSGFAEQVRLLTMDNRTVPPSTSISFMGSILKSCCVFSRSSVASSRPISFSVDLADPLLVGDEFGFGSTPESAE